MDGARIAIDATALTPRATGMGRVLRNLLVELPRADPGAEYVALLSWPPREVGLPDTVEAVLVPPGSGLRWEFRGAQRAARVAGSDLLFTLRELVGYGSLPTVCHLFEPPAYRLLAPSSSVRARLKDRLLVAALGGSLRRARAVTAGSQATSDWLREHHGIAADVVLPGLDPVFAEQTVPKSHEERFVLHPASGDPRENSELALRAFARARLPGVRLLAFGTPAAERSRLEDLARRLGLSDRFEVLGWLTDDELRRRYRDALALLHPTKYEGYGGYPALEAMASSTPVVALDAPGVAEAITGAAELVPRPDADLIAAALERLVDDDELRGRLGEVGRQRALGLSWGVTAAAFAAVFRRALVS